MADEKKQGVPPLYPTIPPANAPPGPYPGMPMQGYQQGPPPPPYGNYGYPMNIVPGGQPQHQGPPPSYYPPMPTGQPGMPPMNYGQYPQMNPNMPPQNMPGSYAHSGLFDSGARFGPGSGQAIIPPPPPGYAPNPAQIAAMQGQPVIMDKKKNNFFSGGKGAGSTFW